MHYFVYNSKHIVSTLRLPYSLNAETPVDVTAFRSVLTVFAETFDQNPVFLLLLGSEHKKTQKPQAKFLHNWSNQDKL